MQLEEHPREYLFGVDRRVRGRKRVGKPVHENDIEAVIILGLTSQYGAEARMLKSVANWPGRDWIERTILNQY